MAIHLTIKSAGLHRIPVALVDAAKAAEMVSRAVAEQGSTGARI